MEVYIKKLLFIILLSFFSLQNELALSRENQASSDPLSLKDLKKSDQKISPLTSKDMVERFRLIEKFSKNKIKLLTSKDMVERFRLIEKFSKNKKLATQSNCQISFNPL